MKNAILSILALGLLVGPVASQAAYITIDDSDPNTITIYAGDFERGFYVNDTLLTSGYSGGSITLADGLVYTFAGSWIDLGATKTGSTNRYFGIGTTVYSGVESNASSDGYWGSISGAFTGFDWAKSYGFNVSTMPQDGSLADFSRPYLSARFISEVPEPSTLALFGLGLLGLGLSKWRKLN